MLIYRFEENVKKRSHFCFRI